MSLGLNGFKIKGKSDGTIDRYKAQLVAKDFDQEASMDYTETFSLIVKPTTVHLILALSVHFDWLIRQLDVLNAFLHGLLEEEAYIKQPQGLVSATYPHHVCRLHKALYGLKQAHSAWFNQLSTFLLELGFTKSHVNYSLFTFHIGQINILVLIYVDDINY